jgi:hypothetical protein
MERNPNSQYLLLLFFAIALLFTGSPINANSPMTYVIDQEMNINSPPVIEQPIMININFDIPAPANVITWICSSMPGDSKFNPEANLVCLTGAQCDEYNIVIGNFLGYVNNETIIGNNSILHFFRKARSTL